MITYYELLEDNTIGRSTPSQKVAQNIGLTLETEKEIVYGYNGKRYFKGEEPPVPPKTEEELDQEKAAIRANKIDQYTLRRIRKMANGTWTDADEQEYLRLDAEVTGYIEEQYNPHP